MPTAAELTFYSLFIGPAIGLVVTILSIGVYIVFGFTRAKSKGFENSG